MEPAALRSRDRDRLGRVGFESGSDLYERARPAIPTKRSTT